MLQIYNLFSRNRDFSGGVKVELDCTGDSKNDVSFRVRQKNRDSSKIRFTGFSILSDFLRQFKVEKT